MPEGMSCHGDWQETDLPGCFIDCMDFYIFDGYTEDQFIVTLSSKAVRTSSQAVSNKKGFRLCQEPAVWQQHWTP
jgi:hypothetical protein